MSSVAYASAEGRAADTRDEAVRPSNVIRDIIGRGRLAGFVERRDGPGLAFAAAHAALMAVTGWLVWRALGTAWAAPAIIVHGIVIVHLFAPFHESTHYTAFRTRWLNTAAGWATGLVLMLPPTVFRYQHTAHHRYTQDIERDPQMIPIGEHRWGFLYYASAVPYFQGILSGLLRQPFGRLNRSELRDVPPAQHATVRREARIFWCAYLALAAASVHFESWLAVQLWLLPRIAGEPLMRIIRMSEHVGCARVPSMLENTRTVFTTAPLRLLAWNMAYHTAHHALPQAPFFRLGALDAVLRDHVVETRDGYVDFVRTHFRRMAAR
jgi:fatty acid desaturase